MEHLIKRNIIIDDINNGKKINDIYNAWLKIKNHSMHKKVMARAIKIRFGTYGQYDIVDILILKEVDQPFCVQQFIKELRQAKCRV